MTEASLGPASTGGGTEPHFRGDSAGAGQG